MKKIELVKRYMDKGMKPKFIADKMGVSVVTVYNYMHRVRKAKAQAKDNTVELLHRVSQGRAKLRKPRMASEIIKEDKVNHPAHYKAGGIETIDFIEAKKLNYHLGNVVKYITRADHKGNRKEDLLKAQWYLNRAISNLEK